MQLRLQASPAELDSMIESDPHMAHHGSGSSELVTKVRSLLSGLSVTSITNINPRSNEHGPLRAEGRNLGCSKGSVQPQFSLRDRILAALWRGLLLCACADTSGTAARVERCATREFPCNSSLSCLCVPLRFNCLPASFKIKLPNSGCRSGPGHLASSRLFLRAHRLSCTLSNKARLGVVCFWER